MNKAAKQFKQYVDEAQHIVVMQAEHIDPDSLGCAVALEQLLEDQGKTVTLFSMDHVPPFLDYVPGWDRVTDELPDKFDLTILVDGASQDQLERTFSLYKERFTKKPFIIIDHHSSTTNLIDFAQLEIIEHVGAAGELIVTLAEELGWKIDSTSAFALGNSIIGDTLGLSTPGVTPNTFRIMAKLMEYGLNVENLRMKREAAAALDPVQLPLKVKGLERLKFFHNNRIAITYFTQEEYESLGDDQNVIEKLKQEIRSYKGVDISVTITERKGYSNASMRADVPVARLTAEYFNGGGHDKAASCRFMNQQHQAVIEQMVPVITNFLIEYDKTL